MRLPFVWVVLSAAAVTFLSGNALACGESIFRAGKGVHYRAFTAPIPGTVLVYASTDDERAVADSLRAAGHEVHVVGTDLELEMEVRSQPFDVIVAPFSKRAAVEASAAQVVSPPDLIPVIEKGSADLRLAKAEYDDVVVSDDDVRKYLKAIHHSLKSRGA